MSDSRSPTTVTILADCNTVFACSDASSQRIDSRSDSGRSRASVSTTPSRVQTSPPTRPRQAPVGGTDAVNGGTGEAVGLAFFTKPKAGGRWRGVGNFTSDV